VTELVARLPRSTRLVVGPHHRVCLTHDDHVDQLPLRVVPQEDVTQVSGTSPTGLVEGAVEPDGHVELAGIVLIPPDAWIVQGREPSLSGDVVEQGPGRRQPGCQVAWTARSKFGGRPSSWSSTCQSSAACRVRLESWSSGGSRGAASRGVLRVKPTPKPNPRIPRPLLWSFVRTRPRDCPTCMSRRRGV
jgi:hypothetical protein